MKNLEKMLKDLNRNLGKEVGLSKWIELNQKSISEFSHLTQDPNFIHVDPERTKAETPFQGTIAHGFFVLSMAVKFSMEALPKEGDNCYNLNYGFNKVRFVSPVLSGSKIRGRFTLSAFQTKGENGILKVYDLTIETQGVEKPAVSAEWLTLTLFNKEEKK